MTAIVTANFLGTGRVAYLGRDGLWFEAIAEAIVYGDAAAAEAGLTAVRGRGGAAMVVEPFVTGYTKADHKSAGGTLPEGRPTMTLRDTIRAYGPTVRYAQD